MNYSSILNDIGAPNGKPLYEYKISNEHYLDIKDLLTNSWETTQNCYACFVIYAVEFLRTETKEGHLRWDYIFNSIKKSNLNFAQSRSEIVENGLSYWKRSVYEGQNREYLETLRFESGFPKSCLYEGGNISTLIKSAFQNLESYNLNEDELIPLIEKDAEKLSIPLVLKQELFYKLVSELCFKFYNLKSSYKLAEQEKPVDYLEIKVPNWRDEMPLKIDSDNMFSFFNRLVSEISKTEKQVANVLKLESKLISSNDSYEIKSYLSIPRGIYECVALGFDEDTFRDLKGDLSLYFEYEGKSQYITNLSITVDRKISITGIQNFQLPRNIVENEWALYYTANESGVREELNIKNIYDYNVNDPLVFSEHLGNWILKGIAPIKIKEAKCWVVLKEPFEIQEVDSRKIGMTNSGLAVFEISHDSSIIDNATQTEYGIKLNQQSENATVIDFAHARYPKEGIYSYLSECKNTYLGLPKVLLYYRALGSSGYFSGSIEYLNETNQWVACTTDFNGIGKIRFRFKDRRGDIIAYKTLNILPHDFTVTLNQQDGEIVLSTKQKIKTLLLRSVNQPQEVPCDKKTIIKVEKEGDYATNTYIGMKVGFDDRNFIELEIPNPNLASTFVDGDNRVIQRAERSLSKIHGLAIHINNYSNRLVNRKLKLCLIDKKALNPSKIKIFKNIRIQANTIKRVPLYQYTYFINLLFSLTQNTNAIVRICFADSRPNEYVDIKNYDYSLTYNKPEKSLHINDRGAKIELQLKAFRLDESFNPNNLIDISISNNNDIMPCLPNDGRWFLFSQTNSQFKIAPMVILKGIEAINGDPQQPINSLAEGSNILEYKIRIDRFKEFFDGLHLNFNHGVWKELYELYKATEHLPMNALDMWKGLVKSPKGMLTYLFSPYADPIIITRLTNELGFVWHMISVFRWHECFNIWLDNEDNIQYIEEFRNIIEDTIGLEKLFTNLNQQNFAVNDNYKNDLFIEINGAAGTPGIIGRHNDADWPCYASNLIIEKFKLLPPALKNTIPRVQYGWQKPIVFLPFILAYHSVNGKFILVQELTPEILMGIKLNINFDKKYFDDIYAKVQGFCITNFYRN
jgi:hypothetical protein